MTDVKILLDRIKNLSYYEVIIPVPSSFTFKGPAPFDIIIEDNTAVCKVLALDSIEAETKVLDFFNSEI